MSNDYGGFPPPPPPDSGGYASFPPPAPGQPGGYWGPQAWQPPPAYPGPGYGPPKSRRLRTILTAAGIGCVILVLLLAAFTFIGMSYSANPKADARANTIGFHLSDFPAGTRQVPGDNGYSPYAGPEAPGTCTPVHSQPFTADEISPTFDPTGKGNDYIWSEVLLMPASDAETALAGISAPGYATECFLPGYNSSLESFNTTSSCGGFELTGGSISVISASGFPAGTVVDEYVGQVKCKVNGQPGTYYADIVSSIEKGSFLQGIFWSYAIPVPPPIERTAMTNMSGRAARLLSGNS